MFEQLGLIGCGLMGGSFALAARRAGLVRRVVGYSKSPTTTTRARQLGVIDQPAASALGAVTGSDLILLAIPVAAMGDAFKAIRDAITPNMLVLDVGSTKRDVVQAARKALGEHMGNFIPSHPIAGSEMAGIEHASADLYAGSQVILTPVEHTVVRKLKLARDLWEGLGCRVHTMSPEAHDAALSAVSHVPHLVAFALMGSIASQRKGPEYLSLAGPGFRDFSRIAGSDPRLWRDVLIANRREVGRQLRLFRNVLEHLEGLIDEKQGDALQKYLGKASKARNSWRMTSADD